MRVLRLIIWLFFGALIIGCAPAYKEMVVAHQRSDICCESLRQIIYQKIKLGESNRYEITSQSPAYIFEGGKSFFQAFELPPYKEPYHIVINSHALDDGTGPGNLYMFRPEIITLDADFRKARRLPSENMLVNKASFGETAKVSYSATQVRVTGQLAITQDNRNEKYMIILTTDSALDGHTNYEHRDLFGLTRTYPMKYSPTGVFSVALHKPEQLYEAIREKWLALYEEVSAGKLYQGNQFAVSPPVPGGYRFLDRSGEKYGRFESYLDFTSYAGKGAGGAFVQSYHLGTAYSDYSGGKTLDIALKDAEQSHQKNISELRQNISEVIVAGATCRRIDFSGNSQLALQLPTRGYDILCIHPDWAEKSKPLVVRIGANYVYGLSEDTQKLPSELSEFYRQVRFLNKIEP